MKSIYYYIFSIQTKKKAAPVNNTSLVLAWCLSRNDNPLVVWFFVYFCIIRQSWQNPLSVIHSRCSLINKRKTEKNRANKVFKQLDFLYVYLFRRLTKKQWLTLSFFGKIFFGLYEKMFKRR